MRKSTLIKTVLVILFALLLYYFVLPPLNFTSPAFWTYIIFILGFYLIVTLLSSFQIQGNVFIPQKPALGRISKIVIGALVIIFVVLIVVNILNSPILNAKSYYQRITINEDGDFTKDVKEVDFNSLPLLDKASSEKLGDRVMGQMPDLVSQFMVSDMYTQINYNNDIVRVTPLEYADIIKYFTNSSKGVAGYIIVNSVTGKSELVRLENGMKYMPSSIFFENLSRKLRLSYPTEIFGEANFEIDNEGKPYWVVSTLKYTGIGLKPEVTGAIILDPVTGNSTKYAVEEVPTWVDHVYPANLIIQQVDDWGKYKNGFLNSIFGQKEVVATTRGYNYIAMNDDIYLYTGITSVISDESNIGFILTNLRTKETIFYSVSGAEEYSAVASAEGQVQQMKYEATFPLLINLNNKPTYFLSLKDNAGLVKMYAFIDVQDYQRVVVTDASKGIETAAKNYLGDDQINFENTELITKTITIDSIENAVIDGTTYYYIKDTENKRYKVSIKVEKDKLPFLEDENSISISYKAEENVTEILKIND